MNPRFEPISGRYLHLELLDKPHRLYVEEAGQGIPLLCLHTAGSDARQFRGLMNDERITANFRVIAFDMPWHGKSSPPAGWQEAEYQLTSGNYIRMILEVADALELDSPVAMGCSIGGRIVLHLAHEHPERFRALIGLRVRRAHRCLLRSVVARPPRRAWRDGLRWRRFRSGGTGRAHRTPVGNAVALYAKRPGRVQGRPQLLHDRWGYSRSCRQDRRQALSTLPAYR